MFEVRRAPGSLSAPWISIKQWLGSASIVDRLKAAWFAKKLCGFMTRSHSSNLTKVEGCLVMVHVGETAPRFRLPALVEREFIYLDSTRFYGRWMTLCFLPSLGLPEGIGPGRQADVLAWGNAAFLGIIPNDLALRQSCRGGFRNLPIPLLTDPLGRLHRSYRIRRPLAPDKCETFLIDPNQVIRFHLVHEFNARGMDALRELFLLSQQHDHQLIIEDLSLTAGGIRASNA